MYFGIMATKVLKIADSFGLVRAKKKVGGKVTDKGTNKYQMLL